ncbi:proline/glycine betaine ABC transporter permease [Marihabitans asiaticum]|uniref:Glycine betaine/proline transport system permease protein n=1 Tax=Marihabitans asiaticum TaxID=415218 RepID=A0A560WDN1_9MICO|nr:proline/glycine betaine ABC transporter permease [Marihabitans asiaticum]TWD15565.1 glycine betaine/proline transport system permease protein [Marihabitans asiaticum]
MNEESFPRIEIGEWASQVLDWLTDNAEAVFDALSAAMGWVIQLLVDILLAPPVLVMILIFALIAWFVRSWQLALGTLVSFALIASMRQWENAMLTLALVLVATIVAVGIAVPIGIAAARNDRVSAVVKPLLDFMQTMPAFVYLIPAIIFFSVGVVPGLFATVIFALPPGVRFTELGIRQVDSETVEAGQAFGATPRQILRGIQIPLATPTIMAGVNQVIMLALSMAVIAGFVGADGLGKEVVASIASLNIPQGVEAGLGVVVLAIFLDRLTGALGDPGRYPHSLYRLVRDRFASS